MNFIKRLFVEEEGQALTEYGLLVGLIAVAVITLVVTLGDQLVAIFEKLTNELSSVSGVSGK